MRSTCRSFTEEYKQQVVGLVWAATASSRPWSNWRSTGSGGVNADLSTTAVDTLNDHGLIPARP